MALPRQLIKIPLGGGVDTKSDVKQVAIGKMTVLENAVFTAPGELQKRFGMSPFVTYIIGGGNVSAGKMVGALNSELVMGDGGQFYSYSPSTPGWAARGKLFGAHVQTSDVFQDGNDHNATDCAAANGFICYAWQTTGGGISAAVFDAASNEPVTPISMLNSAGTNPHVSFAYGQFFVHYAVVAGGVGYIKVSAISATGPATFGAEATCTSILDPALGPDKQFFDIANSGTGLVLAFRTSDPAMMVGYLTSSGILSGTTASYGNGPGPITVISYSNSDPTNDGVYVIYQNTSTGDVLVQIYNLALSNSPSPVVIRSNDGTNFGSITACQPAATYIQVYLSFHATGSITYFNDFMAAASVSRGGGVVLGTYANNVIALSKPVVINGVIYMLGGIVDPIQSSYFLFAGLGLDAPTVVAPISGSGGALGFFPEAVAATWSLANIGVLSNGSLVIPCMIRTDLPFDGTALFANYGIQAALIDFNDSNLWKTAQIGRSLYVAAGGLWQYDGLNLCEVGFNNYPNVQALYTPSTPGDIAIGTRSYIVIYEWTNNYGAIERSNFDVAHEVITLANSTSNTVTIPYLRLSAKKNVKIGIYRTVDSGTTFYKIAEVANQIGSGNTFNYVDTTADITLVADGSFVVGETYIITTLGSTNWATVGVPGTVTPAVGVQFIAAAASGSGTGVAGHVGTGITENELLYTTGGVFANDPPPSVTSIVEYLDRLMLVGLEDGNNTWFSKDYDPTKALSFSASFYNRVDLGRLGVTAAGSLDDKMVFFKPNKPYLTTGQGPLDTGAQNDFITPEEIAADAGCPYPKSVVETQLGLVFKSAKGWYLLDRSLQVQYIGKEVEAFNSLTVSSAVLLDGVNQIRFTHSDGSALVYDYLMNQWSTFKNYQFVGAANWAGAYVAVGASGVVSMESTTSYLDNGVAVQMRAITPWIAMNTIAGFQRLYNAVFVGERKSNLIFNVNVYYDYQTAIAESFTIDMSTFFDPNEPLKIKPARQKCEAIKFEIFDTNSSNIDGPGISFSALSLEVGVKPGTNRVPVANVMVAS